MSWRKQLETLEHAKKWDDAIAFLDETIDNNPNNMDAYIAMNYLLANLITEEDYDRSKLNGRSKSDDYVALSHYYFDESYERFFDNPEYLFFISITTTIADWYMDIGIERIRAMSKKASVLEPDNLLYLWGRYSSLDATNAENLIAMDYYAQKAFEDPASIEFLKSKGAVGEYILDVQLKNWNKDL